ncbi:MAG: RDD family protein [Proteobacteria bacterium]|nr:RDD family protein [Pseudomonadota bacterium]
MDRTSDLAVDSVTGVDVALPVAGPGARSFAFLVDWAIRTVLSVAWYVVAALVHNGSWSIIAPLTPDARWFVFVIAPPAAIYFLYHPAWEVTTRGSSPGKRMAGVRIVSREGGAPGVGSLLTRNVFRLIDSFPIAYALGLLTTMFTRNSVRIGDLAAGTLLVYTRSDAPLARIPGRGLDARTAEVLSELLQRWSLLDSDARRKIAATILSDRPAETDEELRLRLETLVTRGTL